MISVEGPDPSEDPSEDGTRPTFQFSGLETLSTSVVVSVPIPYRPPPHLGTDLMVPSPLPYDLSHKWK